MAVRQEESVTMTGTRIGNRQAALRKAIASSLSLVSVEWRGTAEGRDEMAITRDLIAVRERRATHAGRGPVRVPARHR